MSNITVHNLTHRYEQAKILSVKDVSFTVAAGSFCTFLGPNGAGKSTTISILTTALAKSAGEVEIAGLNLDHEAAQIRQRIGIIFQNPSLDLDLTGEFNIRIHSSIYGVYPCAWRYQSMPREYKARLRELCAILQLEHQTLFQKVRSMSGGMRRKVEIMRALIHNPEILFLDEPTQGLDPVSRREVWNYLQRVRAETGLTIFLTTHYLEEAEGADQIIVIKRGQIALNTTPREWQRQLEARRLHLTPHSGQDLQRALLRWPQKLTTLAGGEFCLEVNSGQEAQEIIRYLREQEVVLRDFALVQPSLEELYIDLIQQPEEGVHA